MKRQAARHLDEAQMRLIVEAMQAMADGESMRASAVSDAHKRANKKTLSPLARTQRLRISGRTIRNGLE